MANQIDGNGIQVQTLSEILSEMTEGFKSIYGTDINIDADTPDGNLINIFSLAKKDILDLIVSAYNSFDPDQAVGTQLDSLIQLCSITRKGGTYTETNISITVDRSLTLDGLDTSSPFTVADDEGNEFQLVETTALSSGTTACLFRAVDIGAVQVLQNTITTPVTIVLGVTAINNPDVPTQDGQDEETDAQLRIRRQKSVALPAQGFLDGMTAALNNIEAVTEAVVYENITGTTNGDGVPGHSIWVIVDGGDDSDIAEVIYTYRAAGCGMYGAESVSVTRIDGTTLDVMFDRAVAQDLYVKFKLTSLSGATLDTDAVKDYIAANYTPGIYEMADVSSIAILVREFNSDLVISESGVSNDDTNWEDLLLPSAKKNKWTVSSSNITVTT